MEAYLLDWANLLVRWLHLIAGIAWVGASFYFVMLDNSLKSPKKVADSKRGVSGELWAVHGGGFYCSQKYLTGPKGEPLAEDLHWSKWESYTTWLSGIGLLAIIYWFGARAYLIDKNVMDLSPAAAIGISIAVIVVGWLVYDGLCRLLWRQPVLLGALVFAFVLITAWALFQVFGPRAAYIHVGVMMGTMMTGNVFFHIIPGQKKMVAEIRAGREPDPLPGQIGKVRSVHNTYLTLPVLFVMISNHYPMTYSNPYGWLVLAVIGLAGALIRQFFVSRHKGTAQPGYAVAGVVLLAGLAFAIVPKSAITSDTAKAGSGDEVSFAQIQPIIAERCTVCHAEKPGQPGFTQAPLGFMLDSPQRIQAGAQKILQQTVTTQAMPIGNITQMTDEERALLGQWIAAGAKID